MSRYVYGIKDYFNMLRLYFQNNQQENCAASAYREEYQNRGNPCRNTIIDLVDRLLTSGQMMPIYGGGRPRSTRTLDKTEEIMEYFEADRNASTRDAERDLGISHSTVYRVRQEEGLDNIKYHYRKAQCLRGIDAGQRLNFCRDFVERTEADEFYQRRILWTDECSFTTDGIYNSHSYDSWSYEDDSSVVWDNLDEEPWVVNVWAGLLDDQLIGPVYLPSQMNGEQYLEFLQNQLPNLIYPADMDIDDLPFISRNVIYQHDSTPAHFKKNVRQYLNKAFPNRWIGRGGPTPWPARSHDLTPIDFFLWCAIKERVYRTEVRSREDCMEKLEEAFEFYRRHPEIIRRATSSVVNRAKRCIEEDGHRFDHLL